MKRNCKLVTPPSPPFLEVVIPGSLRGAASCLESISFKPIDSKGVGKGAREGVRSGNLADNIGYSNTYAQLMSM
jgi:hypothetical protein